MGAGRPRSRRARARHLRSGEVAAAGRSDGQGADAPQAGAHRRRHAQDRPQRPLPGGRGDRHRPRQAADLDDLAGGRRSVHHAADGDHARSRQGDAQRRLLPHAGLRRAHDRHALAAAQDRAPPHAPLQGARHVAHAGGGGAGRRSGAALRGDGAAARRDRRVSVRGLPAPQASRDGAVQDHRPGGPGVGRLRAGRLRRRRRAAPGRAVRRPHRLLLAGRRLPGVSPDGASPAASRRSTRRRSSVRRRRRTPGWARRPSGCFCRCCR